MASTQTPDWLRSRALGLTSAARAFPAGSSAASRLALEATLVGHTGCVNCLDYNQTGNLLISGSDDKSIIVWETFKNNKRAQIHTSHSGNIFSVKFISNTSDTQIASCASDASVKVTDIHKETTTLNCDSCHSERVKRLAVHPTQADLVWSSGEDGRVVQYDLRQGHLCKPKNALIDLNNPSSHVAAKCIAVNPVRDELLAVGGSNSLVYLFDRRFIGYRQPSERSCPAIYAPGHLTTGSGAHRIAGQICGVTYVAFNPIGTELLANLRSEQIYLFDLQSNVTNQTQLQVFNLAQACTNLMTGKVTNSSASLLTGEPGELYTRAFAKLDHREAGLTKKLAMSDLNKINQLLGQYKNLFQLHQLRAAALVDRNWRGDLYESMRESVKALELNPLDSKSWLNLSYTVSQCACEELAIKLLGLIKLVHDKYLSVTDECQQTVARDSYNISEINFATNLLLQAVGLSNKPPSPIEELTYVDGNNDLLDDVTQTADSTGEFTLNRLRKPYADKLTSAVGEKSQLQKALDYSKRYCGHCNINTDIKEANFYGPRGEFIVAGSDDGALYVWDKQSTNLIKAIQADMHIVNCVQTHPSICMLATSGIEPDVKVWSPTGKTNKDVIALELRCNQNEQFVSADPLDAMMMMFYPNLNQSLLY